MSTAPSKREGNGVLFLDVGLAWETHASNLAMKINRNTYALVTLSFSLGNDALFCSDRVSVLVRGSCSFRDNLFRLQGLEVRLVGGLKYRDCYWNKFNELKILTSPSICLMNFLMFAYENRNSYNVRSHF